MGSGKRLPRFHTRKGRHQQPARSRRSKLRIAPASVPAARAPATQPSTSTSTQCSHMGFLRYNDIISELSTPSNWNCSNCRSTESVLACLTCAHFGCDVCAKEHYETTGHPLAMYIVTKSVRCFECRKTGVAGDNRNGELALLKEVLENTESRCIPPSRTRSGLMIRRGSRMLGVGELQHSKLNKDQEFTAQSLYRRRLLSRCFRAWVKARKELKNELSASALPRPVPLGPPTMRTTRARARKRKRGGSVAAGGPARSRLKRVPSSILDGLPMESSVADHSPSPPVPETSVASSHPEDPSRSSDVDSKHFGSSVSSHTNSDEFDETVSSEKKVEKLDGQSPDANAGSETLDEKSHVEAKAQECHVSASGNDVALGADTSATQNTSPIVRSSSAPLPSSASSPEREAKRANSDAVSADLNLEPRLTRSAVKRRRLSADASAGSSDSQNNASDRSTLASDSPDSGAKRSKRDISDVNLVPRLTRSAIKRRKLSADSGSESSDPGNDAPTSDTSNSNRTPEQKAKRTSGGVSEPKPELRLTRSALKRRRLSSSSDSSASGKSPHSGGETKAKSDVKSTKDGKTTDGKSLENDSTSVNAKKCARGPAPFKGITGLRNLGNTCFLNSTIQSLGSSRVFRDFFLKFPLDTYTSRSKSFSSSSPPKPPSERTDDEKSSDPPGPPDNADGTSSSSSSSSSSSRSPSTHTPSASDPKTSDDLSDSSKPSSAHQNPEEGLSISPKNTENESRSLKNPESSSTSFKSPENSSSSLRTPVARTRSSRRSVSFLRPPAPPLSAADVPSLNTGVEVYIGLPPRTPGPSSVPPNPAADSDTDTKKAKTSKNGSGVGLSTPAPSSSHGDDVNSPMPSSMTSPAVLLRQSTEFFQKSMCRREDINEDELDEADEVSLCAELHKLFRVLESGRWAVVTPNHLMVAVWLLMPQFRSYKQQDAHEFFAYFLDCVDEEAKADFDPRASKRRRLNGERAEVSGESCEFVRDNFESKIVTETRCHNCRNVSRYTFPGSKSISLDMFSTVSRLVKNSEPPETPASKKGRSTSRASAKRRSPRTRTPAASKMPAPSSASTLKLSKRAKLVAKRRFDKQECTLKDCMDDAFQPTELVGDSQYRCSKCASLQDATKQDRLLTLPNLLVFHVSRAHWSEAGNQKLKNHLRFPLSDLDLSRFCAKSEMQNSRTDHSREVASCKSTYRLIAVIVHHGRRMDRGHYTSFSYGQEESSWLKFNDMKVARCEKEEVLKSQAYMLIYEREKALKNGTRSTMNGIPKSDLL